jgi:hypothetical protein
MKETKLIPLRTLCTHYHVEMSFFSELSEYGLIEINTIEKSPYIHPDAVGEIEKLIRMYQELNVNPEGIDVVCNLLQKIEALQDELASLKSKLRLYEG